MGKTDKLAFVAAIMTSLQLWTVVGSRLHEAAGKIEQSFFLGQAAQHLRRCYDVCQSTVEICRAAANTQALNCGFEDTLIIRKVLRNCHRPCGHDAYQIIGLNLVLKEVHRGLPAPGLLIQSHPAEIEEHHYQSMVFERNGNRSSGRRRRRPTSRWLNNLCQLRRFKWRLKGRGRYKCGRLRVNGGHMPNSDQNPCRDRRGYRGDCRASQHKLLRTIQSRVDRFVIIASILLLMSDPVTPETHTSGDSAYSLQTLRMASA